MDWRTAEQHALNYARDSLGEEPPLAVASASEDSAAYLVVLDSAAYLAGDDPLGFLADAPMVLVNKGAATVRPIDWEDAHARRVMMSELAIPTP